MLNRVGGGFMDLKKSVFITGATQNTGLEVAKDFLDCGAVAVAAGATLVTPDCLKNDDYEGIMKKAMEFTRICKAWFYFFFAYFMLKYN